MPDDYSKSSTDETSNPVTENSSALVQNDSGTPVSSDNPKAPSDLSTPTIDPGTLTTSSPTNTQNMTPQSSSQSSQDDPTKNSNPPDISSDILNSDPLVTAPHAPKKYGGKKIIATIFGILLLIGGVAAGVILVQNQQQLAQKAASGKECQQSPDCILLDEPGNSGSYIAERNIKEVAITAKDSFTFPPGDTNDGCYHVIIDGTYLSWNRIGSGPSCKDVSNVQVKLGDIVPTQTPTGQAPPSCPANTEILFFKSGSLSVGDTLKLDGKIDSMQGSWSVGSRDGVLMAENGSKISVSFPNNVLLDTVLIYDNDPKSGEQPWSINGVSLPETGDNKWGPPYKLNKSVTKMSFDNGGDSPHFNVCVSKQSVSPTPTNPPEISAECSSVKAYTTNWQLLNDNELKNLSAGEKVRFAVLGTTSQGSFDKARFSVNSTSLGETTNKKPGSGEFYVEYTIPTNTNNFSVKGEIHHTELGWM